MRGTSQNIIQNYEKSTIFGENNLYFLRSEIVYILFDNQWKNLYLYHRNQSLLIIDDQLFAWLYSYSDNLIINGELQSFEIGVQI